MNRGDAIWKRWAVGVVAAGAVVVGATSCTTTTGDGEPVDSGPVEYADAMNEVCADTRARLDALPTPPEQITQSDWAMEVSLILRDEAVAVNDIRVGNDIRGDHLSFIENTEDQAAQWALLSAELENNPDGIGEITTEITELSLGRDDLAGEMGIDECRRDR